MSSAPGPIDSILFVSFGGPESPDDVIPFLENVLRGKPVPRERMLEVAEHYYHFGGISPINAQNRDLIDRLQQSLSQQGIDLPIVWGNRNWKPYISDALSLLKERGLNYPLPIFTNMFSSYSGCRQYRENILTSQQHLGDHAPSTAPRLRFGFNHPLYISAQADLTGQALSKLPEALSSQATLLFAAHSIPTSMAQNCKYETQLREAAKLVADRVGHSRWQLVFQSRSGPPQQPWLEPDICDRINQLKEEGCRAVAVVPLGFVSDHMEVMYDLDTEAKQLCGQLGIAFSRAAAVGTHPDFIAMLVDLIKERLDPSVDKACIGDLPPLHDVCPENCCLYPRPAMPAGRPS
jgi:ferrochelatase